MSPLAARLAGIIRAPRRTSAGLAAAPSPPWADVLLVSTAVTFVAIATLLATDVGRIALVDHLERLLTAFGLQVDDVRYGELRELSRYGAAWAAAVALLKGPVLVLGISLLLMPVVRMGRPETTLRQTASLTAHAGLILALGDLVTAPLNYMGETLASPTSLSLLLSGVDESSPIARFLGALDIFALWWVAVLSIGVAALTPWRTVRVAMTFSGVYVAVALLLALAMAATGGTA